MKLFSKLAAIALLAAISVAVAVGAAQAAEPNEDFATATGPLTAGQTFKASLETTTDLDYQFFYLPEPATISVTTINSAKRRGGAADRSRTIVSSVFRARKGKDPIIDPASLTTVKPGKRTTAKLTLLPGKYFIPVGHAINEAEPLPNVPFRLEIGPLGSTTDSYEIFESRCRAAQRKVDRIRSSIKRTSERIAKAKRNDAPAAKIVKLKLKLRDKRNKAAPAKKAEKFACSIPR